MDFRNFVLDPLQGAQIDHHIDERVEVGDGLAIAQFRALDTEGFGLRIDSLRSLTLVIDLLVDFALSVDLMP